MTTVLGYAATVITVAGLVCLLAGALLARSWHAGLRMALDLWVAAGLLGLTGATATDLLVAATLIAVRQLINIALRTSSGALAPVRRTD